MPDALLVTSSFLPGRGGIESYLAELCARLSPRLAVLAPSERNGVPLPADLAYPTHGLPKSATVVPTGRTLRALCDLATRYRTTKIIFGTPWPLGLLGPECKKRGFSYTLIVHGAELLVPGAVPGIRRRLGRALAGADLLLPVSGYTSDAARALIESCGLPQPPVQRLHARVDVKRFHPDVDSAAVRARLGLAEHDRVVLCFGRLVPRKGVDRLITALPEINRRCSDAVVVVAGTGPQRASLQRLAERTPGRVIFAGRVADDEAPAFYAMAEVFALPVTDRLFGLEVEGLGVVLLEAAACGTPCVAGRSGGTPEAVIDGQTGYIVDAGEVGALADRIAWLLEHPEIAAAMGAAGRDHVAREFGEDDLPAPFFAWLSDGLP